MPGARPLPVAVVGAIVVATAMVLPWAQYGGIEVRLYELPGWYFYVAAAVAQQVCVAICRVAGVARHRVVALAAGLASGAAAAVAAVALMATSQDPTPVFGQVVPPIAPAVSGGGPVALAGTAVSGAASVLAFLAGGVSSPHGHRAGPRG